MVPRDTSARSARNRLIGGGLRVLVLEPFYGGSHREFLDRWQEGSRHRLTLLTFSANHWKWRMRHSAVGFADQVSRRMAGGETWDAVLCTDMLNLAECRGLAPRLATLPTVAYFHENQLTYPVREHKERDGHFAFTNLTTALAADRVWWNSAFHRDDFLDAAQRWLGRLPDHRPLDALGRIRDKSDVMPQGIRAMPERPPRQPGSLRILWAARWEFDKNPDAFFAVVERLEARGVDFRLNVLGERFRACPPIFERAREQFNHRIERWGFQESRREYERALLESDVYVSTANHEFFGVAAAEAVAAGCFPLLPNRLAYPDLLSAMEPQTRRRYLYDTDAELEERLAALARRVSGGRSIWTADEPAARKAMEPFHWPAVCERLDRGVERVSGC